MVASLRQALVGRASSLIERVMTSAKRADYDCESNTNITRQNNERMHFLPSLYSTLLTKGRRA